jgi:predicted tellurium resistance membrane protein TerC
MYGLEKSGNTSSGEYKNYANLDKIFKNMDYLYCLLIYLFASTGFFVFRRKNTRLLQLLALTVLFYVGIHLLIEVQPRYRYEVMPALFIFAAYGIHWICGILLNGIKSNRNPY